MGYEYRLDSALVKPTLDRCQNLQALILKIKSKFALTARCLMSLIGLLSSTEKMIPEGRLQTRPSLAPQGELEIASVPVQPPSLVGDHINSPGLVAKFPFTS